MFANERERRHHAKPARLSSAGQAALADLGLLALGGGPLHTLLQRASAVAGDVLNADCAGVLELIDEQQGLRLVAGVGWRTGIVGTALVGLERESQAGFALALDRPVAVTDSQKESRFRTSALIREHGLCSGASVVIHRRDRPWGTTPWGVLVAHTTLPRDFADEDLAFLQSVANTLALALERRKVGQELRRRDEELAQLAAEVANLTDDRRLLTADALDAEDRTRAQISQLLHDQVLQSLLTARQDLATTPRVHEAGSVRRAREAIVEAITELREAVLALHPVTLAQGGLSAAIKRTADVHSRRGGFAVTVDIAPGSGGFYDQLIVSVTHELLSNVTQHGRARHVAISLQRMDESVVLDVADDGCGMSSDRLQEAFDAGHIGLASVALRVRSCGGRFELLTDEDRGTRVRIVVPAAPSTVHSIDRRGRVIDTAPESRDRARMPLSRRQSAIA